jgi:hypothetical protein
LSGRGEGEDEEETGQKVCVTGHYAPELGSQEGRGSGVLAASAICGAQALRRWKKWRENSAGFEPGD